MKWEIAFRRLLENQNPGWKEKGWLAALSLLAAGMDAAGQARLKLYEKGVLKGRRLPVPVVSVGNLTLGGTGKTPVVEMLAREGMRQGRRVAILSRGYGRKKRAGAAPQRVEWRPQASWREQAERWGDEPLLLARQLPAAAVVVGKNRVRGGEKAIAEFGADLLLLDDGYQYLKLHRDANVLVVDGSVGFGNGRVFPRGTLRERPSGLQRATAVLITKTEGEKRSEVEKEIRKWNRAAPIFYCDFVPRHFEEIGTGKQIPAEALLGKPVLALSGIARPEPFEKSCARLGAKVVASSRFPDHHYFSPAEIDEVTRQAQEKKAAAVVTTEKDALRLPAGLSSAVPFYFLRIAAVCPDLFKSGILSNQ